MGRPGISHTSFPQNRPSRSLSLTRQIHTFNDRQIGDLTTSIGDRGFNCPNSLLRRLRPYFEQKLDP
jgi:hypothetical protein